ncbi:2OG-Fe(II) oxygenase [Streptomyces pacificus]|uniref:2OG-Fe(II) oxygenase n=1 Tax=Streptomyces pacificus TaxID=2705029 RepID=A0A6A0AUG6_9ACTN|nr:2OG-Fe(II) oxygenase [Streptomyces pacificus]GFH36552.1 2OG-Fe(II) oxygenase [Streptomyces pacificus]
MGHAARERLAELLEDAERKGDFSTRTELPAHDLRIEVDGVGELPLPLRAPVAKKLIAQARQARFGRGEETLSDTSVRDTWEITPDRITLSGPDWDRALGDVLDGVRSALGLPPTTALRAEPHALLVYGKGQFFLPHQDSEKDDSMVGTLVVSLPSHHSGGELVVEHAGRSVTHRASRQQLTFVAFYADCRHEVRPVTSGYRVTLTMNLLAERVRPTDEEAGGRLAELAHCLTEHFTTPAEQRYSYGRPETTPPNRLVYLLDHEYTQRGLDWDRLKGADAARAARLRQAAGQAGCEAVLALAEVQETWDAAPPYDQYDQYDHYGEVEHFDDCEDEECEGACLLDPDGEPGAERRRSGDFSDYELNELVDDEITLGWWTLPEGPDRTSGTSGTSSTDSTDSTDGEAISLPVAYAEVCATTENKDLTPYRSEYEGYMGNYGNTLDRWYRRAAVVLWPRQQSFASRAEAGSEWALRELQGHLDAGALDHARTLTRSLAPIWGRHGSGEATAPLFAAALRVAVGLREADTAAMLIAPFEVETLAEEHAPDLARAAERYGRAWARETVGTWFGTADAYTGAARTAWLASLPALCTALRTADGDGEAVAAPLVEGAWRATGQQLTNRLGMSREKERRTGSEQLGAPLAHILLAAGSGTADAIVTTLRGLPDTALECLVPALRAAGRRPAAVPDGTGGTGGAPVVGAFHALADHCRERLAALLTRPVRAADDWSLPPAGACGSGCGLCPDLDAFLTSRSRRVMEWPLAQARRRHIHSRIDLTGLPVSHTTRRQGRPYTLVLTKTDAVFTREREARVRAETDLAWLRKNWPVQQGG